MHRVVHRAALAGATALAALALGAGSAQAAPTFTVKAGSGPTGTTVAFGGASTGTSPQITWYDTTKNTTLTCASATLTGSTKTGTGLAGTGLARFDGSAFAMKTCTGPFGLKFTFTGSGTWRFTPTSGSSTGVAGTLTDIVFAVDAGSNCRFRLAGSLPATYTNSTKTFRLTGTSSPLIISNVIGGCFGAWADGDATYIAGSFLVTATNSSYNPITITSP